MCLCVSMMAWVYGLFFLLGMGQLFKQGELCSPEMLFTVGPRNQQLQILINHQENKWQNNGNSCNFIHEVTDTAKLHGLVFLLVE